MKRSIWACSNKLGNIFVGAVLLSVISSPVFAEVEGNITMASQYIWRGIDRNNTNPAVQGGFDLNFQNGLYGGVWGSNVSVEGEETTNNVEMDIYGGYTRLFNDFGLDLAFIRYEYPKALADFEEVMLQGSYKGLSLTYYQNINDPKAGESENYVRIKAELNLPGAVGLTLSAGQNSIKGQDEVNDALIGFTKFAGGVKLGLSGTTSNLNHVTTDPAKKDIDTEFVTVSISKAL